MKALRSLVVATLVACAGNSTGARDPDVAAIQFIARRGPRAVLDSAFRDAKFGGWLFTKTTTGDSAWLDIARRLRPVSDAGASEDLDMELAIALPKAPERVLRLLEDSAAQFSFDWVCRGEVNMDDIDTAAARIDNEKYRRIARAALAGVRVPELVVPGFVPQKPRPAVEILVRAI